MMNVETTATDAPRGQKTIQLTITFYTNDLPEGRQPKVCWPEGYVAAKTNDWHGIHPEPNSGAFFRNVDEIGDAVKAKLAAEGIRTVPPKERRAS